MSFKDAQKLVAQNKAKVNDFWVFAGYAGWGPNQLMGELDRKSWYMAATSSQTLLQELAKQSPAQIHMMQVLLHGTYKCPCPWLARVILLKIVLDHLKV